MQIDWFTFGAQLVNFLILVGLLKRFLYGPILNAMDEREARITSRLEEARAKRAEAEEEAKKYRSLQDEFEQRRQEHLAEAERKADKRRQELIQEAREEVDYLEREWREALQRERASFLRELTERAAEETIAVARRALNDLADANLEAQAIEVFIRRLQTLGSEQQRDVAQALQAAEGRATVRSAFELTGAHQRRIREVIEEHVGEEHVGEKADLAFEAEADIGFGIELRVEEYKIAWSLDSYLEHLTEHVRERLDAELRRGSAPGKEEAVAERASANEE